ncbi:hypothetical protein JL720_11100 [Aureococcus anophagefferens]|nr:hypothetical protein JL720_11100 [Aureococcus anophagefferens]
MATHLLASHLTPADVVGRFIEVTALEFADDGSDTTQAYVLEWKSGGGLIFGRNDAVVHTLLLAGMRRVDAVLLCDKNVGRAEARVQRVIARTLCASSKPFAKALQPALLEHAGEFKFAPDKAESLATAWARAAARSPAFFCGEEMTVAEGVSWVRRKIVEEKITNPDAAAPKERSSSRARNTENLGRVDMRIDDVILKNAMYPAGWVPFTHGDGKLQVRFFYLDPYEASFDGENVNRAAHDKAAAPAKPALARLTTDDEFADAVSGETVDVEVDDAVGDDGDDDAGQDLLSQLSARMTALRAHVADDDDDDEGSDWGDD